MSAVCVEAGTGRVLHETHGALVRPPASMLKMMLMLLVAEGIEAERWRGDTVISVSARAAAMGGTQVFLSEGETRTLEELMQATAVASANDAAMAVGEGLWGGEAAYLRAANERAQRLGMRDTVLRSIHGLPPDPGELPDETTARDMATLARACVKMPRILAWTSRKSIRFRPGAAEVYNTNKLLWRLEGCDGLKTGYIRAAGFCLTATAERSGVRLVCVVMGAPSYRDRYNVASALLEAGFARIRRAVEQSPPGPAGIPSSSAD